MKTKVLGVVIAAGLLTTSAFAAGGDAHRGAANFKKAASATPSKPVNIDDVSYAFGFTMGSNMQRQKMKLNIDQFITGLKAALAGKDPKQNKQEMMQTLMQFQRQMMRERMESRKVDAEKNKAAGEKFLTANKAKKGIVTLPSGLQYKIITAGTGDKPLKTDRVKVNYTGMLLNGEEFANSNDPKKPAAFGMGQVIPGWKEALQLMKKGATWELYVPSKLAYGARGTRGQIGPNSTLIFKIHLIEVEKQSKETKTTDRSSRFKHHKKTKKSS